MREREIFNGLPMDKEGFAESFKEEARRSGYEPVPYLGLEFAKLGKESLKRKEEMFLYDVRGGISKEEAELFSSETTYEQLAILVGHLMMGMHEAVSKGTFDLESVVSKFNEDVRGTPIMDLKIPAAYKPHIDMEYGEYLETGFTYSKDQTMTSFFRHPNNLPDDLRRYLTSYCDIFTVTEFYEILDVWEEKARLLVGESSSPTNETPTTKALAPIFTDAEMEKLEKLKARIDANYK